jgi:hypothetical protein
MRMTTTGTVLAILAVAWTAAPGLLQAQSCVTTVNEANPPTVFTNIQTTETGFDSYFWEWGSGTLDQDGAQADLLDSSVSDLSVAPGINWANVSGCGTNPTTTGLLVWAQTTATGGKVALTVGSQNNGVNVDLDTVQSDQGGVQSVATVIPGITVSSGTPGNDGTAYTDYAISWSAPDSSLYAVNDQGGDVLAGYAVYYRTDGPQDTGDTDGWSRLTATASSTDPYITDDGSTNDQSDGYLPASQTSCTVRTRGSSTYWFALALRFDGTGAGAGSDREADASAVEAGVVGPSSAGTVGPLAAGVVGFTARQTSATAVLLSWTTAAEDGVAGFAISRQDDTRSAWASVASLPAAGQAGAGAEYSYTDQPVTPTAETTYRLDVIGTDGSVLSSITAPVRLRRPVVAPPAGGDTSPTIHGEQSGGHREPRPPR